MNLERLINEFTELVAIESESGNELTFAKELKRRFEALGFTMSFDDAADHVPSNSGNLYGIRQGEPERRPIIFSCHMDTVTPGVGIKPQIKADRITSDGTTILASDDKAPIASLIEAIRSLDEENAELGTIELVFSVGEEVGMHGARHFDVSRLQGKTMFVLDSSGTPGKAIVQAPTAARMKATITGRAAHAGLQPEKGISAISVMSEAITAMPLLRIDQETTANVGTITGGSATNIVAEQCEATFEARSLQKDKLDRQVAAMVEALETACRKHDATLDYEVNTSYPPLLVSQDSPAVKLFKEAAESLGLTPTFSATGGGSDANIYAEKGLEVLIPACGMSDAHSVNEYILLDDLESLAQLVRAIITTA